MTQNEANLFFIAEYAAAALILGAAWYFHFSFDIRKSISRKTFLLRILLAAAVTLVGIGAMTGVYLLHLGQTWQPLIIGGVLFLMSVTGNTILFASWTQRCAHSPRGKELAAVLVLLYIIADLFMPAGAKYAVALVGSLAAYFTGDQ